MLEYPVIIHGPLKWYFLLGKNLEKGESAGNFSVLARRNKLSTEYLASSETTREAFILKNKDFKDWFIGFSEADGSFIINKDG